MNPKGGEGNCEHMVWAKKGRPLLANNDDGYYITEFESQAEVDEFIRMIEEQAKLAFGS